MILSPYFAASLAPTHDVCGVGVRLALEVKMPLQDMHPRQIVSILPGSPAFYSGDVQVHMHVHICTLMLMYALHCDIQVQIRLKIGRCIFTMM
jgi:hypothetical protein